MNFFSDNKFYCFIDCTKAARKKIQFRIIVLVIFTLLIIYLKPASFVMDSLGIANRNGCSMLTFTGIPCPVCGMGRSFSCLTDFNIAGAFHYNPSGPVVYLFGGLAIIYILILSFKNKMVVLTDYSKRLWVIPILLIVIIWVLNVVFGVH